MESTRLSVLVSSIAAVVHIVIVGSQLEPRVRWLLRSRRDERVLIITDSTSITHCLTIVLIGRIKVLELEVLHVFRPVVAFPVKPMMLAQISSEALLIRVAVEILASSV